MINHKARQALDQKKKEIEEIEEYKVFMKECFEHKICCKCGCPLRDLTRGYDFFKIFNECVACGTLFKKHFPGGHEASTVKIVDSLDTNNGHLYIIGLLLICGIITLCCLL